MMMPQVVFLRQGKRCGSNQPQPLQARVPVLADDDVVEELHAERLGDGRHLPGHLDVGRRGRRVAGGVVVQQATNRATSMISFIF